MGIARNLARIVADNAGAIAAANLGNAIPADGSITGSKIAANAITAPKVAGSGMIVSSQSYNSGTGSGARLTTNAVSWQTLPIGGNDRDSFFPASNSHIRWFDKKRSDTHLRIKTAIPMYITPGGSGGGVRVRMVLSDVQAVFNNDANYFTVGSLSQGQAHGWGAGGYGGDHSGIIHCYYDTAQVNSSVLTYTGKLHFYFQVYTWSAADTIFWSDYDDSYPKYATWTVEEYVA